MRLGGEPRSSDDHVVLIGDAAGMIDPMTGKYQLSHIIIVIIVILIGVWLHFPITCAILDDSSPQNVFCIFATVPLGAGC